MTSSRLHPLCLLLLMLLLSAPSVSAQPSPLFDDHGWRAPAAAAKVNGTERELTPELLLKTELKEPVFLFDPTDDETITYITDFKGKLYLASCTQPAATDTGSVYTYDPDTSQWQKVFQVNDQGLVRLEVYGDRLYIAGYDANDGGWDLGNIYVHDGATWIEHRTVPRAIHEYGLAVYRDRLYVSGDVLDPPPPGMTAEEAEEKGLGPAVYGRVLSSGDGGLTWREEYRGPQPGQDIGAIGVWHDHLILNANGGLLTFDGKHWKSVGLSPNALIVFDYTDGGDTLLLGTSLGLCFFDGRHFRRSDNIMWVTQIRAVRRFGSSWALIADDVTGGTIHHGPRQMSFPSLSGKGREPFLSTIHVVPDDLMQRAARADLPRLAWWREVEQIASPEMLTSAHAFRGRLYLGTHPNGRVLVLPVVKEGTLDSAPHRIPQAGTYHLTWDAATPIGTSCRLQVRTAPTVEALAALPFTGPDGAAATFFEAPGAPLPLPAGYLQYRVTLTTDDPALTPYLRRVTLTR